MIGIFVSPRRRRRQQSGSGQLDTTPPIISGLTIATNREEFSVFTNEPGTLFWIVDTTTAYASLALLLDASSSAALGGSQFVSAGNSIIDADFSAFPSGNWRLHVGVLDAANNASSILSMDLPINIQSLELNGDPLEWGGDQLVFNAA